MNEKRLFAITAASCAIALSAVFAIPKPIAASAEGEESAEVSYVQEIESEIPSAEESQIAEAELPYRVKDARIRYRNSESESFAEGDHTIGSYYLSADGWSEDDDEPIRMTVKGAVTTKLDSKILYIYEYRVTSVYWNGEKVSQSEDKTYALQKPSERGEYDLSIDFTKTPIINPMELTQIDWTSFITLPNIMTILSWVILVAGVFVLYFLNRKYKARNATTLDEVKTQLSKEIEEQFGEQVGKQISDLLNNVVSKSYSELVNKVSVVDDNMTTLIRCLLIMQENTPEARLAVTEYLAKLNSANDDASAQVKLLIQNEMDKYKAEEEAKKAKAEERAKAIEEAQKKNDEWKAKAEEDKKDEGSGRYGVL